jgi:hypothetical protein
MVCVEIVAAVTGVSTQTGHVPAVEPGLTIALIELPEANVVGYLTPLTLMTLCFRKLVPVAVNRRGAPPAGVDAGEMLLSDGVTW